MDNTAMNGTTVADKWRDNFDRVVNEASILEPRFRGCEVVMTQLLPTTPKHRVQNAVTSVAESNARLNAVSDNLLGGRCAGTDGVRLYLKRQEGKVEETVIIAFTPQPYSSGYMLSFESMV
jgi:hypothetical protein